MIKQEFVLDVIDDDFKQRLKKFFDEVEVKISKPGISDLIFQIVFELINNATKANLKRMFFLKNGYSFEDEDSYFKGLEAFKDYYRKLYSSNSFSQYDEIIKDPDWIEALRDLDLKVRLLVDIDEKKILIYVINNSRLHPEEEKRLRKSLSVAMQSKNLIDFMINYNIVYEEGEGLGLPLIILLIKEAGFNPDYFRVYKENQNTIARIELPLNKDYIPIRERWKLSH